MYALIFFLFSFYFQMYENKRNCLAKKIETDEHDGDHMNVKRGLRESVP